MYNKQQIEKTTCGGWPLPILCWQFQDTAGVCQMQEETTNSNVLDGHSGSASQPALVDLASIFHWLSNRWSCSTLRIVVFEICNFPRRLSAIRQRKHLRFGPSIPTYPTYDSKESRGQGYEFACSCISNIQRLRADNRWAGFLDLEFAAEAYQAGANWAICNRKRKDSKE